MSFLKYPCKKIIYGHKIAINGMVFAVGGSIPPIFDRLTAAHITEASSLLDHGAIALRLVHQVAEARHFCKC